jgi:hypothetical protein
MVTVDLDHPTSILYRLVVEAKVAALVAGKPPRNLNAIIRPAAPRPAGRLDRSRTRLRKAIRAARSAIRRAISAG